MVDLGLRRVDGQDLGRNAGVIRQGEGRANIEGERNQSGLRDIDFAGLDMGQIENIEFRFFEAVAIGLAHNLLLEFIGDLLAVMLLNQSGRGLARAKAREAGHLGELGNGSLMFGGDFALLERDYEVLAGCGDVFDFDVHVGK